MIQKMSLVILEWKKQVLGQFSGFIHGSHLSYFNGCVTTCGPNRDKLILGLCIITVTSITQNCAVSCSMDTIVTQLLLYLITETSNYTH